MQLVDNNEQEDKQKQKKHINRAAGTRGANELKGQEQKQIDIVACLACSVDCSGSGGSRRKLHHPGAADSTHGLRGHVLVIVYTRLLNSRSKTN